MRRRGLTLAEVSVAMLIGMVLALVCQTLVSRADRLFDATRRQIELSTDVRALVETMLRDVASAQQFLTAPADQLVLVRSADVAVGPRLAANATWSFPFADGASTTQRFPGVRVTYRVDRASHQVWRREEAGALVASTADAPARLAQFAFEPAAAAAPERLLCSAVQSCAEA